MRDPENPIEKTLKNPNYRDEPRPLSQSLMDKKAELKFYILESDAIRERYGFGKKRNPETNRHHLTIVDTKKLEALKKNDPALVALLREIYLELK